MASYPVEQRTEMALRVEAMFDIPCGTVPNFLNLTLTPSNQILHPGEKEGHAGMQTGPDEERGSCLSPFVRSFVRVASLFVVLCGLVLSYVDEPAPSSFSAPISRPRCLLSSPRSRAVKISNFPPE